MMPADEMLRTFMDYLKFYDGHSDTCRKSDSSAYIIDSMFGSYLSFYESDEFNGFSHAPTTRDLAVLVWSFYNVDMGLEDRWATIEEIEEMITPFCEAVKNGEVKHVSEWMDENLKYPIKKNFSSEHAMQLWADHEFLEHQIEEVAKNIYHVIGDKWSGYVSVRSFL